MKIKQAMLLLLIGIFCLPFASALTSGEGTIIFGSMFSVAMTVAFFLIISIIVTNGPMKMFFMSMSLLSVLASVGMGVSVLQEFFGDLTGIVSAYGSFYILLITLTAAGLFALIVWLIIVAVHSFRVTRGLVDED